MTGSSPILGAFALAALVLVPGAVLLAAARRKGALARLEARPAEQLFLVIAIGFLACGWCALVLAELGLFSAPALAGMLALPTVGLMAGMRLRPAELGRVLSWRRLGWPHLAGVAAVVVVMLCFGEPFHWAIGGDDSGTYVNAGANIARTGAILIEDDVTREASAAPPGTFFYNPNDVEDPLYSRLPYRFQFIGFFITDAEKGSVCPQGLHMVPAWVAVFTELFGLPAGLWLFPLVALLGVVGFFLTARRVFGTVAASAATILVATNFLELWFARYPTSEMFVQATLFIGLYLFALAEELDDPGAAALSAAAISMLFFIRVDTAFIPALMIFYMALAAAGHPRVPRRHVAFLLGLVPGGAHALLHLATIARPYLVYGASYNFYLESWFGRENLLLGSLAVFFGALLLLVLLLLLAIRFWAFVGRFVGMLQKRVGIAFGVLLSLAVVAALVYAWFWRPELLPEFGGRDAPQHPDGASLVKLGWYLSPVGLVLAAGGTLLLVWRKGLARLFLMLGLLFGLFYLYAPLQFAPHPQWARKFMPVVVPFACLAAGLLLAEVPRRLAGRIPMKASIAVVLAGALALGTWNARLSLPFVGFVEYEGVIDLVARVSRLIPEEDAVVLMPRNHVGLRFGQPLRYVEGRRVVLVDRTYDPRVLAEQVGRWQKAGRPVYLVAPIGNWGRFLRGALVGEVRFELPESERPTSKPAASWGRISFAVPVVRLQG